MLERHYRAAVGALVVLGVVVRLALIRHYPGQEFDLSNERYASAMLTRHGLRAYAYLSPQGVKVWPYAPVWLLPVIVAIHLCHWVGVPAGEAIRAPLVVVDAAMVVLVQYAVRLLGRGARAGLVAAGLVALGPPFLAETALQGQFDIVATFCVLSAAVLWIKAPPQWRWLLAGLALGLGAAIKTVPAFAVLALIPTAIDNRERLKLAGVVVAVPALVLLPFEVAYHGTAHVILGYHGLPGLGGLSVLVQPTLVHNWPASIASLNAANHVLRTLTFPLILVALISATWFAMRHRLHPYVAAVLIYGAVLVATPNFFLQYAIWLFVPLIAAGYLRTAAVMSVCWILPILVTFDFELHVWPNHAPTAIYAVSCDLVWCSFVAVVVAMVIRFATPASGRIVGSQPATETVSRPS